MASLERRRPLGFLACTGCCSVRHVEGVYKVVDRYSELGRHCPEQGRRGLGMSRRVTLANALAAWWCLSGAETSEALLRCSCPRVTAHVGNPHAGPLLVHPQTGNLGATLVLVAKRSGPFNGAYPWAYTNSVQKPSILPQGSVSLEHRLRLELTGCSLSGLGPAVYSSIRLTPVGY